MSRKQRVVFVIKPRKQRVVFWIRSRKLTFTEFRDGFNGLIFSVLDI